MSISRSLLASLGSLSVLGGIWWSLYGCAAVRSEPQPQSQPATTFYVYDDAGSELNNGTWSNYMPAEAANDIHIDTDCRDNPKTGSSCVRIEVSLAQSSWAGVAVASSPNYWGETPGPGFNLVNAKKLAFWVRGNQGGERVQFKMGIAGDKPCGDSCQTNETDWIELTHDWQLVEMPLQGDLSRIITPFVFVVDDDHNDRDKPIVFFIDGIQYKMGD